VTARAFDIHFFGSGPLDPENDNVDVEVRFETGEVFGATLFTLGNVAALLQKYRQSGECLGGSYFWAADMIIVESLTREAVRAMVEDLIRTGEFETAFARLRT
jgi:hypothetical protein